MEFTCILSTNTFLVGRQWDFNERHTDDETLHLFPALYSIDINKL